MSIPCYPVEMMGDLFSLRHDISFPVVQLIGRHFRKCKQYDTLVVFILRIISDIIIRSKEIHKRDDELFDFYIDMMDTTRKNMDIGFMRSLIKTMVKMFPGKLRRCEIHNAPKFFRPVYNLISGLIPKSTRDRVYFIN